MPCFFAWRMTSTVSFALTWQIWTWPPVSCARAQSRAAMIASAAFGYPLRPSFAETGPSFITKPRVRVASSQCERIGFPNIFEYSSARRISSEFRIGIPSSENATAPASAIFPSSASSSPLRPFVTAPTAKTFAPFASLDFALT